MKRRNEGLLGRTLMLALGIFLALPMVAIAQQRNSGWSMIDQGRRVGQERREDRRRGDRDSPNYGGSFQLRQTALNAGYNEGIKEGRKDRNRSRSNFRNNSAYRNASDDYSSKLGNKALYQRYYREGYENGYEDGYNGN